MDSYWTLYCRYTSVILEVLRQKYITVLYELTQSFYTCGHITTIVFPLSSLYKYIYHATVLCY